MTPAGRPRRWRLVLFGAGDFACNFYWQSVTLCLLFFYIDVLGYKALFVQLDKNYTESSGWGLNIAYTLSKGEQNGGDLFSLDEVTPDAYGWRPRNGDERHRVVVSGIVDLPLGFQFSTLSTLGSGEAFLVTDTTAGADPGQRQFFADYLRKNCIKGVFTFCEVNLTLANKPKILGGQLEVANDLLNAFNSRNFSGFNGSMNNRINPATGQVTDPLDEPRIGTSLLTLPTASSSASVIASDPRRPVHASADAPAGHLREGYVVFDRRQFLGTTGMALAGLATGCTTPGRRVVEGAAAPDLLIDI